MNKIELKVINPEFRNLRDISDYSKPNVKSNILFRSSDLSAYENDPFLRKWFNEKGIKTIIDLRNIKDIMRRTYSPEILNKIKYLNIKLVSDEIDEKMNGRDTIEYYSWVLNNEGERIREIFNVLSDKKNYPILIHCLVGMDRTGIILALIHFLLNSPREKIIEDYLKSGSRMKHELIDIIFKIVDNYGGICQYLNKIGISFDHQTQIIGNLTR